MKNVKKRLIIIGGVAAGATAAARARRLDEDAEITIVEKGRYVSFANCGLPYRVSGDIAKRSALILQTPEGFYSRYRVRVLVETEAVAIDRESHLIRIRGKDGDAALEYDSLILAQGGSPVMPPIAGSEAANVFRLWTIPDMDAIQSHIDQAQPDSALVVGGGFIGLEAAEAFLKRGLSTTIVELTGRLMPPADPEFGVLIARAYEEAGARVLTGRSVKAIEGGLAILNDGSTIGAGIVLISAGVRPNLELAQSAGLELGSSGALAVDDQLRSSDPSIWAAGDMVEVSRRIDGRRVRMPLAGPANRQGRIAATNALGGSMRYAGSLGTSVFKAMDYSFAMTGLTEKAARESGIDVGASTVHKGSHASYYPGATELTLKLVYDRSDGRLLGAQAFGKEGVDKRIDAAAASLAGGLGVDELAEIDFAYAPPFSSANDPLNIAAFAASNELSGYSPLVSPSQALSWAKEGNRILLDVRSRGDFGKGRLPGSLNLPVDELRDRMDELPSDGDFIVISRAGFEGHLAVRQLLQSGFPKARYVSGGMTSLRLEDGLVEERD